MPKQPPKYFVEFKYYVEKEFQGVNGKLAKHDGQLEFLAKKMLEHDQRFDEVDEKIEQINEKLGDIIGMLADRLGKEKDLQDENIAGAHRMRVMQDQIEDHDRQLSLHDEDIKDLKLSIKGSTSR